MNTTEFTYVTYINSTPDEVWNALIDNDLIRQYWGNHKNVSDWQPGSIWLHQDYDSGTTDIEGKVVEIIPPDRLVLSWSAANEKLPSAKPSLVSFETKPALGVTQLRLSHTELEAGSEMYEGIKDGWPKVLSSLKTLLETGSAIEIPRPPSQATARKAASES